MKDVLVFFLFFGALLAVVGIAYTFLITRHRERKLMIDKGVDPSIFVDKSKSISPTLKFGMLFVGVALGIIVGEELQRYGYHKGPAYLSMVFLFGGLSLIINFVIERKLQP